MYVSYRYVSGVRVFKGSTAVASPVLLEWFLLLDLSPSLPLSDTHTHTHTYGTSDVQVCVQGARTRWDLGAPGRIDTASVIPEGRLGFPRSR